MAVSDLKEKVLINETIQPGENWDKVLSLGQLLKITDVCGQQGVDFLCYNAQNPKDALSRTKHNESRSKHTYIKRFSLVFGLRTSIDDCR